MTSTLRKSFTNILGPLTLIPCAILLYTLFFRRDLTLIVFVIASVLALLLLAGDVVASVVDRRREGKYIFSPRFPDALFSERWLSGRGHKRILFQRAGANNCLWLAVTEDRLMVGPMFPFNLMFLPDRLGLEHDLPGSAIVSVTEKSQYFGRPIAIVRFRSDDDTECEIDLMVRDFDGFVSAVEYLRGPSTEEADTTKM